ncbi:MAG: hypothetical protein ACFFE1_16045 [Candidatus Thorarchaeota archaeon]
METDAVNSYHLILLGIFSILRVSALFYWIYWFGEFIFPVIFITEEGLFFIAKLPMILDTLDLALAIGLLVSWRKIWHTLFIDCFAMIAFSLFVLISFGGFAVVIGLSIILLSLLQIAVLSYVLLRARSRTLQPHQQTI